MFSSGEMVLLTAMGRMDWKGKALLRNQLEAYGQNLDTMGKTLDCGSDRH